MENNTAMVEAGCPGCPAKDAKPSLWLNLILWLHTLKRGGLSVSNLPLHVIEALGELEVELERVQEARQVKMLAGILGIRTCR